MDTSTDSSPDSRNRFRCVTQGHGATFTFDNLDGGSTDKSNLVGTTNCLTCVGVYLPISRQRCFVAHINAYVTESDERVKSQQMTFAEGSKIKNRVVAKLHRHAASQDWHCNNVVDALEGTKMTMRAVIICRYMDDRPDRPGRYVLDALEHFTGCDLREWFDKGRKVEPDAEAFVLNQNDCAVNYFRGDEPLHEFFVRDKIGTGVGDWDFEIER